MLAAGMYTSSLCSKLLNRCCLAGGIVPGPTPTHCSTAACSCLALTGAPLVRTGALNRTHPMAAWETPLATPTVDQDEAAALAAAASGAPDINSDRQTAEDVAAADPLSGLLKMGLLQRCRWAWWCCWWCCWVNAC
jgi:hypothetical protein